MSYAWIITRDHLGEPDADVQDEVGIVGPANATEEQITELRAGGGVEFRMYDGDKVLYYTGRLLGDPTGEDGFAPLDDFGTPNAGAVSIHYRTDSGEWEQL